MEYITGIDLYKMMQYGMDSVLKERVILNDTNVFPVPDGDTGNNLVHTLQTISRESKEHEEFKQTLQSVSESALLGARGNSGIIFAQFINGMNSACNNLSTVTKTDFANLVEESVKDVYKAISNPVEGTMITVIREWGVFLKQSATIEESIKEWFFKGYEYAKSILLKTKEMLEVLKKNDVVDSGALGFVKFLDGINRYYNQEEIEFDVVEQIELEDYHDFEGEITYRYCTEGLLEATNTTVEELQEALLPLGDSQVVVKGEKTARVHIHTDQPEQVFQVLGKFGTIISQKADDMALEMRMKNSKQKRVLVTDSIADLDPKYIDNEEVVVIPINVVIGQTTYLDKSTINNDILFDLIEQSEEYPTTATPSIKLINNLFMKLLLMYEEIIVITVAKQLSATHDVIKNEVDKLVKNGNKVYLIDSLNNSVSEGLLVKKALDMMKEGTDTNTIISTIEEMKQKTRILVCLDTFKYAMRSGRVPKVVGKIGMAIKLRPIMSLDETGKGTAFGFGFSQTSITKKITKLVQDDLEKTGIKEYAIVHCQNLELAKLYAKVFTNIIGKEPEYITDISSATSIHSGVGSVAIGYIRE